MKYLMVFRFCGSNVGDVTQCISADVMNRSEYRYAASVSIRLSE